MSILKTYIRGLREIASAPPGRMAVPSASGFAGKLGAMQGAETARDINTATRRAAAEYDLNTQKQDMRSARSDAMAATAIGVANVALSGLTARDRLILAKREQEDARRSTEQQDVLIKIMNEGTDRFLRILSGEPDNANGSELDSNFVMPTPGPVTKKSPLRRQYDTDFEPYGGEP